MYTSINSQKINYEIFGEGELILLLHGWGGNLESLKALGCKLDAKGFKVILLDLLGFGKSDNPKQAFSLDDYAEIVEKFLKYQKISNLHVFGHSFGGSVAIKLALRNNVSIKGLILCNSSGIRDLKSKKVTHLRNVSKVIKMFVSLPLLKNIYPNLRKFFYYYILGERDYIDHLEISGTFRKVISEDLTPILEEIEIPTLLLWGEQDKDTPIEHAEVMKSKIRNCKLQIVEGVGHGLPKLKPELVAEKVARFCR